MIVKDMVQLTLIVFIFIFSPMTSAVSISERTAIEYSKNKIKALAPYVGEMAQACYLHSEKCNINDNAQEATLKWIGSEVNRDGPTPIIFSDDQDRFFIDGAIRIARTGSKRGDPIIFNERLLLKKVGNSFYPLGLFEIAAIFIHELGHHQHDLFLLTGLKELPHDELDIIAAKTVNFLKTRTRTTNLADGTSTTSYLPAQVININYEMFNGRRNRWSRYFLDNSETIFEFAGSWENRVKCPIRYQEGRVVFDGRPTSVALRRLEAPVVVFKGNEFTYTQVVGKATVNCYDDYSGFIDFFDGYLDGTLHLVFSLAENLFHFVAERSFFTAKRPKR